MISPYIAMLAILSPLHRFFLILGKGGREGTGGERSKRDGQSETFYGGQGSADDHVSSVCLFFCLFVVVATYHHLLNLHFLFSLSTLPPSLPPSPQPRPRRPLSGGHAFPRRSTCAGGRSEMNRRGKGRDAIRIDSPESHVV